ENVCFGNDEEAIVNRQLVGEVQVAGCGRCSEGGLQSASPKRNVLLRIRVKESRGDRVAGVAEFVVPIGGELVVREFPRLAHRELNRTSWRRSSWNIGQREEISIGGRAKLIALESSKI